MPLQAAPADDKLNSSACDRRNGRCESLKQILGATWWDYVVREISASTICCLTEKRAVPPAT